MPALVQVLGLLGSYRGKVCLHLGGKGSFALTKIYFDLSHKQLDFEFATDSTCPDCHF